MTWLDRFGGDPLIEGRAGDRALWLTGQSSLRHSLLSPAQHRVLDALAGHGWDTVRGGLPWTTDSARGEYRKVALPLASLRNTRQFLAGTPGGDLAVQVARALQPVLDATERRVLVLAGSSGARLLASAAPLLRIPAGVEPMVIGVGPVGRLPGAPWRTWTLRGRHDLISAIGYRGRMDRVVSGGHLRAVTGPAAVAAILDWADEKKEPR